MIDKDLPSSWTSVPLDGMCERIRGVSYSGGEAESAPRRGFVPILRANNITDSGFSFEDLQWVPNERVSERQMLKSGDIVVAMSSGSKKVVGKAAQLRTEWEGSFGAFCGVLRPHHFIDPSYLGLFLQTSYYRSKVSELAAGTNINNLKAEHFSEIEVPLPPLNEQRRIVAKLDELLAKVESAKERLEKIPAILKRFRQSVLAAAVSGRLTDRSVDESNEDRLPEGWLLAELGNVGEVVTGNTPSMQHPEFYGGPIPWVKPADLGSWQPIKSTSQTLTRDGSRKARLLPPGAVLVSCIGNLGRVGFSGVPLATNQQINAVIFDDRRVDARYGFIACHLLKPWMEGNASATTISILNKGRFLEAPIVIPPLDEQREIVRRVESLITIADRIEARYSSAKSQVEKMTQSILAKAFRGELVPQDPKDEPAGILLERIRAERAQAGKESSRPKEGTLRGRQHERKPTRSTIRKRRRSTKRT